MCLVFYLFPMPSIKNNIAITNRKPIGQLNNRVPTPYARIPKNLRAPISKINKTSNIIVQPIIPSFEM